MSNMNEAIERFESLSASIVNSLSEALKLVDSGIAPDDTSIEKLGESLSNLRESYLDIRLIAEDRCPSLKTSAELSVSDYADAINQAESLRMVEVRYEEVMDLLTRFVSIVADSDDYSEEILPFQNDARELMKVSYVQGDEGLIDSLEDRSTPQRLFLQALEIDDLSTEEGERALDQLTMFSRKATRGLIFHKYRIGENGDARAGSIDDRASDQSTASESSGGSGNGEPGQEQVEPDASTPGEADNATDAPRPDEESGSHSEAETPSPDEIPEAADSAEGGDTLNDLEPEGEEPIEPQTPIKRKKNVSASSAKQAILRMPLAAWYIVPLISMFEMATTEELSLFIQARLADEYEEEDFSNEAIDIAIEALVRSDLIAIFPYVDKSAVCLTDYGKAVLSKKSIVSMQGPATGKRIWPIPIMQPGFSAGGPLTQSEILQASIFGLIFARYLQVIKKERGEDGVRETFQSLKKTDDKWSVEVPWGLERVRCSIYAAEGDGAKEDEPSLYISIGDSPLQMRPLSKRAFLATADELYKWDGKWVSHDGEPGVADSPLAEEERKPMASAIEAPEEPEAEDGLENSLQPDENASQANCAEGATDQEDNDSSPSHAAESNDAEGTAERETGTSTEESPQRQDQDQSSLSLARDLVEAESAPDDERFVDLAKMLIEETKLADDETVDYSNLHTAIALLKAASTIEGYEKSKDAYRRLVLATDSAIERPDYTGTTMAAVFSGVEPGWEAPTFAAYCMAMLRPRQAYDYNLQETVSLYLSHYEEFFPSLAAYKSLFNELTKLNSLSPEEGLSQHVIDQLGDQKQLGERMKDIKAEAEKLLSVPKIKAKMVGIPDLIAACFGKDSEFGICMSVIAEDDRDGVPLVREIYEQYCDHENSGQIDISVIDDRIDDEWHNATEGKRTSRVRKFAHNARKQVLDAFVDRLDVMHKWLEYSGKSLDGDKLSALRSYRDGVLDIVREIESGGQVAPDVPMSSVLVYTLGVIQTKLSGIQPVDEFAEFLRSGWISLDSKRLPVIDSSLNEVRYFEPWRNVIRHICSAKQSYDEAMDAIDDPESPTFDNLQQLELIREVLGLAPMKPESSAARLKSAQKAADAELSNFNDALEIAYAYTRIGEVDKENLAGDASAYKERFYDQRDFGMWRGFLQALERQINDMSSQRGKQLEDSLAASRAKPHGDDSTLLNEAERLLKEEQNYAVVEEYLNRFDAGEYALSESLVARRNTVDDFANFISDGVFIPIFNECIRSKGRPLSAFGMDFVRNRYPAEWTSRQKDDCSRLLKSWPDSNQSSRRRGNTEKLVQLFRRMGIETRGTAELKDSRMGKYEQYEIQVKPTPKDQSDYLHPIAAFGTQMKSPMNVFVLFGHHDPVDIVNMVASKNMVGLSVVLIDYPVSLASRRQIAEDFHSRKTRLSSFIIIDQVLALYLALRPETERLSVLLKCSLPFTYYQPFVRDGGPTADEMFFGRERELREIVNKDGASVVYGGRQLGKTALLERAESLCNLPERREYAVYVSIQNCGSEQLTAEKISNDIARKTTLDVSQCETLDDLAKQIDGLMRSGDIKRLLLLIDESDNFLESIKDTRYDALQPLVELKRETKNDFKFVLAGLHNVSRAKNATAQNGVFGQLGEPLCVRPLAPTDALDLISRPLSYLGFKVDLYPHLETILTSTNYYPGILQFFGYTLIETMTKQYGIYYRAADGNPPFTLHKEQLGSIMSQADLNNSIKEKFRLSLELDSRYFMLARCIGLLYYQYEAEGQEGSLVIQKGFSAEEVKDYADSWGIHCLANETVTSCRSLLEEMVDMGILACPSEDIPRFRLRRYSFLNIIGATENAILDDIQANNEVRQNA